jgi:hypothetical protein
MSLQSQIAQSLLPAVLFYKDCNSFLDTQLHNEISDSSTPSFGEERRLKYLSGV